jgi:hypothetical protein
MKTHDATCRIGMAGLDTSHVPAFAGSLLTIDCKGYDCGTDMVVRVAEIAPQR